MYKGLDIKTRMGLLLAGKKAGLSYHETIDDYNKSYKKYQDGGEINTLEGDLISKVIMNRNKDKDFVQRAYAVGDYPESKMFTNDYDFNERASHRMGYGEDDNGQSYMFPTVMNPNREMVRVPNQYAEYISSKGYKNATGMNKYKDGGEVKPSMQLPNQYYNPSENVNQQIVIDPYLRAQQVNNVNPLNPTKLQNDRSIMALDNIKKRRLSGDYTIPDNTPKNVRQYAEISPTGYSDPENYIRYVSGKSRYDMDKPNTSLADEEAWMKYNNIPHKNKNIIPSKFRPSKSTDNSIIYNKFNNETDSLIFNDIEKKLKNKPYGNIQVGEMEMYNGPSTKTGYNMYSPLGNFTIGKGKDEKGEYVSYYDKYDFDSAPKFIQDRLTGNEFEYYNRRYLKTEPTFKEKWDLKNKTKK